MSAPRNPLVERLVEGRYTAAIPYRRETDEEYRARVQAEIDALQYARVAVGGELDRIGDTLGVRRRMVRA